jgi:hypothetical protein
MQGDGRWATWIAASSLLVLALALILLSNRQAQRALVEIESRLGEVQRAIPASAKAAEARPADFARSLGAAVPSALVIQEIQRACSQAGVTLATLQVQERSPTLEQLGRSEFALTLRGPYPATKQVIKQIVERFPNMGVKHLRMQRAAAGADIESALTLSLWSAPLLPAETPGTNSAQR